MLQPGSAVLPLSCRASTFMPCFHFHAVAPRSCWVVFFLPPSATANLVVCVLLAAVVTIWQHVTPAIISFFLSCEVNKYGGWVLGGCRTQAYLYFFSGWPPVETYRRCPWIKRSGSYKSTNVPGKEGLEPVNPSTRHSRVAVLSTSHRLFSPRTLLFPLIHVTISHD